VGEQVGLAGDDLRRGGVGILLRDQDRPVTDVVINKVTIERK